jgi:GGDEF domain-containing protein
MKLQKVEQIDDTADPVLVQTAEWVRNVIARPHPNLGRRGAVCPYVPPALKKEIVWLAVERVAHASEQVVDAHVRPYRDVILDLEPTAGEAANLKTIIVLFPDVIPAQAARVIDGAQISMKPYFVERGLMLGEFHPMSESRGLHNAAFRPLRSPVPAIVIRYMMAQDLEFLLRDEDSLEARRQFLSHYLRVLDDKTGARNQSLARESSSKLEVALEAESDTSTGAAARGRFDEMLRVIRESTKSGAWLSLLLLEVEGGGEEKMADVVAAFRAATGSESLPIARFSGSKLAILAPGYDNAHARDLARDVARALEHLPLRPDGSSTRVFIGGAAVRCRDQGLGSLISAATDAVRQASMDEGVPFRIATPHLTLTPPVPDPDL